MKTIKMFSLMSAIALLLPALTLADEQGKTQVHLTDPVEIGSARLQPGSYQIEWTGTGPSLTVNFLKDDKTVASAPGKMIELNKPAPYDAVVLKPTVNGQAKTIDEIDVAHHAAAVRIESTTVSSSTPMTGH